MYIELTEAQLRHRFLARGIRVCKSRARVTHANNAGGYMLLDGHSNSVLDGCDYDLTLSDLRERLPDWEQKRCKSWAL